MKNVILAIVFWSSLANGVLAQKAEQAQKIQSGMPNMGVVTLARAIDEYTKSNQLKPPANWSEIWNPDRDAHVASFARGQPFVYHQIAFVEETPHSKDSTGARIIAITREGIERDWKDKDGNPVMQRGLFLLTSQNQVRTIFVDADKSYQGVELNKLILKEPDPTPKQLAATVARMFVLGYTAEEIYAGLGNDDIEIVRKGVDLDPAYKKELVVPPVSKPEATIAQTLLPVSPTPKPEAKAFWLPIWPMAILGTILAVTVFLMRRRSR